MSKKKSRIDKSVINPQTADFKPTQTITIDIPPQLLMLCRLINIPPKELIIDFMDNLSCGSWRREGRDRAKQLLIEYFIEHGYGRERFSALELQSIFKELDALGMLFPKDGDDDLIDAYAQWRKNYQQYWLRKWSALPSQL